jgi:hypothetical protein
MMAAELMIARQLTYFSAPGRRTAASRCDLEAGMAKLLGARVAWAAPTTRCRFTAATASRSNTGLPRAVRRPHPQHLRGRGGNPGPGHRPAPGTGELEPIRSRFTLHALNALKANIDHENSRNKALYQKRIAELEEIAGDKPAQLETPEQSARITGKGWKPVYRLGPDAVLDCLIHATESANPKPYYRVTYTTKLASLARRFLPDRLQYKLMLRSS